jgi:HlyD family secretion protein
VDDLLEGLRIERSRVGRPALRTAGPGVVGRWRNRTGLLTSSVFVLLVAMGGLSYALATRPLQIEIATVTSTGGAAAPALTAGGYVRAARIVYVAPKVAGRIAELRVKEGDEVAAGDVLATIETRDLTEEANEARANRELARASLDKLEAGARPQEIAEAKARLEAATFAKGKSERELARARALFEQGILSAQALDLARTAFLVDDKNLESVRQAVALVQAGPRGEEIRTARAAFRAADARWRTAGNRLTDALVRAPIAGRVLRKFRNVGDFVSPDVPYLEGYETIAVGSPVVALTDLGPQEVSADINETDIGRVALRQPVEVVPNAYPQLVLHGTVTQVSPRADRNKNTIEVKVTIEKATTVLRYDASVKLAFVNPASPVNSTGVTVPANAIVERAGKRFVFVVSAGRASQREIEGRAGGGDLIAVTNGLSDGEQVAVSQLDRLKDGSRVSPK